MKLLSRIDAFGIRPSLLMDSHSKYQTIFGSVLSIILGIIIIGSFVILGRELFIRKSPSVNLSSEYIEHPAKMNFYNNLEFLIALQKEKSPYLNESLYNIKAFVYDVTEVNGQPEGKSHQIQMERCDKISDETQFKDFKNSYNLSNFYCLSPHQDNNPSGMTKDCVLTRFMGIYWIQNDTNKNI